MTTTPVSVDRTVVLPTPDISDSEELRWPPKSPATTQDYSLDVTVWAEDAGETVTGFTAVVTTNGSDTVPLTLAPVALVAGGNVCTVILSGGASPTDCSVTFLITTPTRNLQLTVWILVANLSVRQGRLIGVLGTSIDPGTAAELAALQAALTAEIARAEAAEGTLTADVTSIDTTLAADATAIAALQSDYSMLSTGLNNFESLITAELNAEVSRAEAEEANLQAQISAITGGQTEGFVTLPELAAAVAAETDRAEGAEATLAADIAAIHGNITVINGVSTYSSVDTLTLIGNVNVSYSPGAGGPETPITNLTLTVTGATTAALAAETSRAETEEASLQAQINEITAGGGVTTAQLNAAILVETNRAEAAESSLGGSITAETSRAQAEEASLQGQINSLDDSIIHYSAGANISLAGGTISLVQTGLPVILHGYSGDAVLGANATCLIAIVPTGYNYHFPAGLTDSLFVSTQGTAQANTTLTLLSNGVGVGTVLFPAGSSQGTATVATAFTVAAGTALKLVGPTTPDTHLAGIATTLLGSR